MLDQPIKQIKQDKELKPLSPSDNNEEANALKKSLGDEQEE